MPPYKKPFTVYSQSLKDKLIAQSNLESDLRHALAANEQLSMVYQPIVNTIDGKLIGCEAVQLAAPCSRVCVTKSGVYYHR